MGNEPAIGHWRTPAAERDFLALFDELRAEQFGGFDDRDVETRYGTTRVYHRRGPGVPIVMLPGAGAPA
ncbi:MAG TPA: alpha/beta hydrolase, partial [Acidimicrobiia bacterium]|nr:alpha/beta hydrolase [Acidimicrobiia bacterium]